MFNSALICAIVPDIVTEPVPEPDTAAPLEPAVTVSVPSPTESVAVSLPPSLSLSLTEAPVFFRFRGVCSPAL